EITPVTATDAHPATFSASSSDGVLAPAPGFVCLPRAVLRAPGLSVLARLLYATLLDYARQDSFCYPGVDRLRADLGVGHNQLARAIRELEAGGLVVRRRRGFGHTTIYHLLPLPAVRPGRRALPGRTAGDLADAPGDEPRAPRTARPVAPGPGPQRAPDRGGQDQDPAKHDAADQHPSAPPSSEPGVATPEAAGIVARLTDLGVTPAVARAL